jgi:hypothetical protein
MVPQLVGTISSRARKRTVYEGGFDGRWISDIRRALSVNVLAEYLGLWHLLSEVVSQPDI